MHVKVLEFTEYPENGEPWYSEKVPVQAWEDIELFIRRLDRNRYPFVWLWPTADEGYHEISDDEVFQVMGGRGAYSVTVTLGEFVNRRLDFPAQGEEEVWVWESDQGVRRPGTARVLRPRGGSPGRALLCRARRLRSAPHLGGWLSPVILHHLEEHARGGDDTYRNLVVLCLNHHALAHSRWDISRHPTPTGFLRERKENFEAAVAAFKRGERPAPGREGTSTHPAGQLDVEALRQIAQFLDRPAVFRPFEQEGNMHDFLAAMKEVIEALNTGYLQAREGDGFRRTQAIREFHNPEWQEKLLLVRDQLDITRARVETAIRKGDLLVHADGFYVFRNRQLPEEIDAMRRTAVLILNGVLSAAGIPPVKPPQRERYA